VIETNCAPCFMMLHSGRHSRGGQRVAQLLHGAGGAAPGGGGAWPRERIGDRWEKRKLPSALAMRGRWCACR
jgi:hypothetical protein